MDRINKLVLQCLLLLGAYQLAAADIVIEGTFTYPAVPGLVFYQGETVNVSYTSNFANASLWTFCWMGTNHTLLETLNIIGDATPNNGSELVTIKFDQIDSDECWFNLRDNELTAGNDGINSISFSISSEARSQTTIGLTAMPTTSLASTVTTAPTAAATTTASGASAPTTTSSSHSGGGGGGGGPLDTAAQAGVGVGVALGAIGLAALGVTYWMIRRKKKGSVVATVDNDDGPHTPRKDGSEVKQHTVQELETSLLRPQELSSTVATQELAAALLPPQELPGSETYHNHR